MFGRAKTNGRVQSYWGLCKATLLWMVYIIIIQEIKVNINTKENVDSFLSFVDLPSTHPPFCGCCWEVGCDWPRLLPALPLLLPPATASPQSRLQNTSPPVGIVQTQFKSYTFRRLTGNNRKSQNSRNTLRFCFSKLAKFDNEPGWLSELKRSYLQSLAIV